MQPIKHRTARAGVDSTGWLLGTIIVVLAVLDLMIWATLWNVPNPISTMLAPQAAKSRQVETASFTSDAMEPGTLAGRAPAMPPSRTQ